MKILFVVQAYYPREGGGVRYAHDVLTALHERGHQVDIVTVNDKAALQIDEHPHGRIYWLPKHFQLSTARLSLAFPGWLAEHVADYDLLHFHGPDPIGETSFRYTRWRRRNLPPSLAILHAELIKHPLITFIYNRFVAAPHLQAVNQICVGNPNFAQNSPLLQSKRQKTTVIPYGIDTTYFHPAPNRQREQPLRLLFVGRLVAYKGVEYLIEAMNHAPGILTIVGRGPLESEVRQKTEELGLTDCIHMTGYVSDEELLALYQQADVFILPSISRAESFGYVLAEAMACETAAISTEIGSGTSYINQHVETGFVVPPCAPNALADAIIKLDRDRHLLQQYKVAARQRVEDHFSVEATVQRTLALYHKLGVPV